MNGEMGRTFVEDKHRVNLSKPIHVGSGLSNCADMPLAHESERGRERVNETHSKSVFFLNYFSTQHPLRTSITQREIRVAIGKNPSNIQFLHWQCLTFSEAGLRVFDRMEVWAMTAVKGGPYKPVTWWQNDAKCPLFAVSDHRQQPGLSSWYGFV